MHAALCNLDSKQHAVKKSNYELAEPCKFPKTTEATNQRIYKISVKRIRFFNVLLHACGLRHLFALSNSIFLIIKLIVEAIKSSFIILYSFLYISCLCVFGPGELTINVFFNRQIFNLLCGVLRDLQLNVYYRVIH